MTLWLAVENQLVPDQPVNVESTILALFWSGSARRHAYCFRCGNGGVFDCSLSEANYLGNIKWPARRLSIRIHEDRDPSSKDLCLWLLTLIAETNVNVSVDFVHISACHRLMSIAEPRKALSLQSVSMMPIDTSIVAILLDYVVVIYLMIMPV